MAPWKNPIIQMCVPAIKLGEFRNPDFRKVDSQEFTHLPWALTWPLPARKRLPDAHQKQVTELQTSTGGGTTFYVYVYVFILLSPAFMLVKYYFCLLVLATY